MCRYNRIPIYYWRNIIFDINDDVFIDGIYYGTSEEFYSDLESKKIIVRVRESYEL